MNLLSRVNDAEIHLWTPKEQVKAILEVRFRRRKETRKHAANVLPTGTPLTAGL